MAQVWYRGAFAVCSLVIYITSPIARFCDQQPLSTNYAMYGMLPTAPHTRVGYLITQTLSVLISTTNTQESGCQNCSGHSGLSGNLYANQELRLPRMQIPAVLLPDGDVSQCHLTCSQNPATE